MKCHGISEYLSTKGILINCWNMKIPLKMCTIKFLVALGKIKQIIDKYFYRSCKALSKRLWHRCLPVNFAKFLRTPFLQNTFSGCFSFHLRFYFGMLNLDNTKTEHSARPVKIFVDYLLYFSQSYQKFYRNCFYWNLHLSNIHLLASKSNDSGETESFNDTVSS